MKQNASIRPTETDLISEAYDRASTEPHTKTLIICSAQRTGSNELCRFLLAAGIGIPLEYFNSLFVPVLAGRWGALGTEPNTVNMDAYVDALRSKRSVNGVLAFKVQYQEFESLLRNRQGERLFEDAVVVHLFRPDAVAQFESYYIARQTGQWDHTDSRTTSPQPLSDLTPVQLRDMMESLFMGDAQFRVLFTMLGIRPMFLSMDDLFAQPDAAIRRIAQALDVPVNETRMSEALAASKRYDRGNRDSPSSVDVREIFKPIVFRH